MSNYIVMLERQGQPLQRLQLVARDKVELIWAGSQTEAQP
jgi:hypothetical protein